MINKNKFSIKNTKKVLHKVGKQWVVVSAVLLGLVAGGAAVNETANAAKTQTTQSQQSVKISPTDKAKAQNAISKLKANKGDIVNKSINEVHAHVNPRNSAQSNAYQSLAGMASAGSLANFSNGAELGSANTSSSHNTDASTWLGALQSAENDANIIGDNSSHLSKADSIVNSAMNQPIPAEPINSTISINPSSANQYIAPIVQGKISSIENSKINSKEIASIESNISNKVNSTLTSAVNAVNKMSKFNSPLWQWQNITVNSNSTSTSLDSSKISVSGITPENTLSSLTANVTAQLPQGTTVADVINNKVSIAPTKVTMNIPSVGINVNNPTVSFPYTVNASINIPNENAPQEEKSLVKNAINGLISKLHANEQSNTSKYNININSTASSSFAIPGMAANVTSAVLHTSAVSSSDITSDVKAAIQRGSMSEPTVGPLNSDVFSTNDIANIIQGEKVYNNSNSIMNAIESEAHNQIWSMADKKNSTKATRDLDAAVDAIHAGNQMLAHPNMSNDYDNIVNALATLPNDSTNSSEASQLQRAANDANDLANSYASSDSSSATAYSSADSSDTISLLRAAARQASSVATSLMRGSSASAAPNTVTPSNNNSEFPFPPFIMPSSTTNVMPASASANTSNVAPEKHAANYVKVIKALQLHTSPNFTKRNAVAVVKPGTEIKIEKSVKAHNGALRYEVRYNKKNYFITANKHWVSAYYKAAKHVNYRYTKVTKALQLHTSAKFTKRNGVKVVKPGTELRINNVVKNHGLARYEVRYQGHNYFITANSHFTVNAYLQKSNFSKRGYKAVRAIKPVNEYRHVNFTKRGLVRHFRRGTVLPVRRVLTIGKGEVTRLQLTNGRYVSANKNLVNVIK